MLLPLPLPTPTPTAFTPLPAPLAYDTVDDANDALNLRLDLDEMLEEEEAEVLAQTYEESQRDLAQYSKWASELGGGIGSESENGSGGGAGGEGGGGSSGGDGVARKTLLGRSGGASASVGDGGRAKTDGGGDGDWNGEWRRSSKSGLQRRVHACSSTHSSSSSSKCRQSTKLGHLRSA